MSVYFDPILGLLRIKEIELDENGQIPETYLPASCFERLTIVADETARFALTTDDVQNGDFVKQTDTEKFYIVKDDTKLDNANGYEETNKLPAHNHNLNDLNEKSYNSLTDKPDLAGLRMDTIQIVNNANATISSETDVIKATATTANITMTLPDPTTATKKHLYLFIVDSIDPSMPDENFDTKLISAGVAKTINGQSEYFADGNQVSICLYPDGNNWIILNQSPKIYSKSGGNHADAVFIGNRAGQNWDGGVNQHDLVFVGTNAGRLNTATGATIIGENAGEFNNARGVVLMGEDAGRHCAQGRSNSGDFSVFIGRNAGDNNGKAANLTGRYCIGIGRACFNSNRGNYSSAIGYYAGYGNTGDHSTFYGAYSGRRNTGDRFIGIGSNAGHRNTEDDAIYIGSSQNDPATEAQGKLDVLLYGRNTTGAKFLQINGDVDVMNLTPNLIVETNANKRLVTVAKNTAYNKDFGTTSTTVAVGNHNHNLADLAERSYNSLTDKPTLEATGDVKRHLLFEVADFKNHFTDKIDITTPLFSTNSLVNVYKKNGSDYDLISAEIAKNNMGDFSLVADDINEFDKPSEKFNGRIVSYTGNYSASFAIGDWVLDTNYKLTILKSVHGCDNPIVKIYDTNNEEIDCWITLSTEDIILNVDDIDDRFAGSIVICSATKISCVSNYNTMTISFATHGVENIGIMQLISAGEYIDADIKVKSNGDIVINTEDPFTGGIFIK